MTGAKYSLKKQEIAKYRSVSAKIRFQANPLEEISMSSQKIMESNNK